MLVTMNTLPNPHRLWALALLICLVITASAPALACNDKSGYVNATTLDVLVPHAPITATEFTHYLLPFYRRGLCYLG